MYGSFIYRKAPIIDLKFSDLAKHFLNDSATVIPSCNNKQPFFFLLLFVFFTVIHKCIQTVDKWNCVLLCVIDFTLLMQSYP